MVRFVNTVHTQHTHTPRGHNDDDANVRQSILVRLCQTINVAFDGFEAFVYHFWRPLFIYTEKPNVAVAVAAAAATAADFAPLYF